jgi:hypothetical protein
VSLSPRNPRLLGLRAFAIAAEGTLASLDLAPFGVRIAREHAVDPLSSASGRWRDRLAALDAATFGPEGMPMPAWAFLDVGALAGAIVGLGCPVEEASPDLLQQLGVGRGEGGLLPLAMYIAVPSFEPGTWVGHNLASGASLVPDGALAGLGAFTKALALKAMRARHQIGVTQWAHPALHVHARLGPLELLSAWTPAHSDPASLTYRAHLDDAALRHLARDEAGGVPEPPAELWIDSGDEAALQALQERIEAGERLWVVGPPETGEHGRPRVPVGRAG